MIRNLPVRRQRGANFAQALIKSRFSDYALITGSDKGMGKTHDVLEYTAASASVSLLLGKDDLILKL